MVGALRVHPHKHCANYPSQKIEDLRRSREQLDFAPCTSFNRDVSLARLS